ncbi:transforming growth factor-beta receptor-associated protein 1-like isoform X2 [Xenia sp. Carnegie-2017]|uniref:transforming growth factor-beta receptor-associated protein 1-like isoform X2 n=1 Tax=Xenia sp. Carnegie-2017 TaxID=2897299 RepID=UPI001F04467F|nr:transforming growth factor-beta receptor-associated protein 1-like isoform X2 [Xenia sp. Carnegie-2017]
MSFNAFDLVSVIDRVQLMGDKAKTTVQCLDCAAQNLFVGTGDSLIIHYIIADDVSPSGKPVFEYSLQGYKSLSLKKPVQQLLTAAAINRLLVLCDGVLFLLSIMGLEMIISGYKDKLKGATCIARNDNPSSFDPFAVEVCVGTRKKAIYIAMITEDNIYTTREITLNEPPIQMNFNGNTVCVALSNVYCNIDIPTSKVQELISYEPQNKPIITRITTEEFLLSGPTDILGMFVTSQGTSLRPPLSWTDGLVALGYSFPYVIAVGRASITVYSILESDKNSIKEVIPFQAGCLTCSVENKVFICTEKSVFCLVQITFKKQIENLLKTKKVEEAIRLAKVAMQTELGSSRDKHLLSRTQQEAGLIYLMEGKYTQALELMHQGNVDVRELIAIFSELRCSNSLFKPQIPGIDKIRQLISTDADMEKKIKIFVLEYLEESKGSEKVYNLIKEEIDTALLKLYAEENSPILQDLICNENACAYEDSVDCLQKHKRFHCLALLHKSCHYEEKALQLWTRLVDKELEDPNFPGIETIIKCLTSIENEELIWRYVPWIMKKDQSLAVRIFCGRSPDDTSKKLQIDYVMEYFSKFPKALQKYLEYLVYDRKLQNERYHSRLAILYLDEVLTLIRETNASKDDIDKARLAFRSLLKFSSLYNASLLLSKISEDSGLDLESAILYGRLEHHEKALKIYVHRLQDYEGAVTYCEFYSKNRETAYRKRLFHQLLTVYLNTNSARSNDHVVAAVRLLNSHIRDFEPIKVIEIIPDEWSVRLISPFLLGLSRESLHASRNSQVQKNLRRAENIKAKKGYIKCTRKPVTITDETYCRVCRRTFNDSNMARYPNNIITHVHCAKHKTLCPVTGQMFPMNEDL